MALQTSGFRVRDRWIRHFYLCNYKPKKSGEQDKLSQSLLRFKNRKKPDLDAWTACSVNELSGIYAGKKVGVVRALGHDEISIKASDSLTKLCDDLCRDLLLKNCMHALVKVSVHRRLASLTRSERINEISGQYLVNASVFVSETILVVDDILTTGATSTAIVTAILDVMPTANVSVFTLARCSYESDINRVIRLDGANYSWSNESWIAAEENLSIDKYADLCKCILDDEF